jgi:hypothetical protein
MMNAYKQKRSFQRKPCSTATVYSTESTWSVCTSKPIFRREKPNTNARRQGVTLLKATTRDKNLKLFRDAVLLEVYARHYQ